jgi:hypothetical protein
MLYRIVREGSGRWVDAEIDGGFDLTKEEAIEAIQEGFFEDDDTAYGVCPMNTPIWKQNFSPFHWGYEEELIEEVS